MEKIELITMMEKAIDEIVKTTKPSEKFMNMNIEDEFFEDSCKYVEMRYQLSELSTFLNVLKKLV